MGREEQKEEREVLDSIFPDEITDISDVSFRVAVTLEVEGTEDEPLVLWLTITFPESYPDEAPLLDLSTPPNALKYADLDIQADKSRLLESLTPTIEDNIGMQMVFTLISTLKDAAELLVAERQKAAEAQAEIAAQEQEAKENEKFHGRPVTVETFGEWRDAFVEEMKALKEKERLEREEREKKGKGGGAGLAKEGEKLTGKMLWEKGLAGKAGEEEDEDGDDGEDAIKRVEKINLKE